MDFWDEHYYRWDYYHQFALPELLEIAVLPNMITTIKVGDALLEQRMAWIDNHIDDNYLHCRLQKLHKGGWNNRWRKAFEKIKYTNPLKNKPKWDWDKE